ncbi:rRNA-processing protein MPP10 KNAG_0H02360 [Huiozyma naganishii CBS 8797]|uniref:U3 small nucleolar ribonucleoprotein protein MPP10 n=1 Tax=Huiozyma naganishii (strain ATCC MYA-139 / BCRC 22969 / CBS 8797 / KCTC 17520 / NBRC 10181 / NCYC 3082 / Yp74L-3) TaxID=1071383 RepID=J7S9Q9_HUIN7|nr:hypothetical protein KNAG_0H02360 [Kazachstania naganishii CBS 8797]CCK71651.1 hypothetical protein KNAG_0H02360 [Kazachstania naganishii CBS 8797]
MSSGAFVESIKSDPLKVLGQGPKGALKCAKLYLDAAIKNYKGVVKSEGSTLPLNEVVVEGLDASQVWWQAKMIVDGIETDLVSRIEELRSALKEDEESDDELEVDANGDDAELSESGEEELGNAKEHIGDDSEGESDENDSDDDDAEILSGVDDFDDLQESEDALDEVAVGTEVPEVSEEAAKDSNTQSKSSSKSNEGKNRETDEELNDKFFDIDEFNRQTLAQEDGGVEEDDDEEEVDYFADVPSEEDEEVLYFDDFFDKPKESKKQDRDNSKEEDKEEDEEEDDNDEYVSAINSAKLDLFEEEDENEEEESDLSSKKDKLTSFERQQLEIQEQIALLEEEAVAEKKWALKGEVNAKNRPENALLTEDLEFERTAKPVPIITTEVTETLEEMIRRRIKDSNFDDLARRVAVDLSKKQRKPAFELSDTKSSKSLAEIYENDYKGVKDDEEISEELKKSHDEITEMFNDLNYKLDALSSAHFVPKPAQKTMEVRVNTAAITMEDAQPLTMSSASTLAPQEVYKVGKSENDAEIRLNDGTVMARGELSREDKTRLRRAAKRKRSKQYAQQKQGQEPAQKRSKKDQVIETLSRAKNLTVINKKGEKHDVKGKDKKDTHSDTLRNVKL